MTERDRSALNLKSLLRDRARDDCPNSVVAPSGFVNAAPDLGEFRMDEPIAALSPAAREAKEKEPIEQGNAPGFLASIMLHHMELSPPSEREAIKKRVEALKTVGEAVAYIDEVMRLSEAEATSSAQHP